MLVEEVETLYGLVKEITDINPPNNQNNSLLYFSPAVEMVKYRLCLAFIQAWRILWRLCITSFEQRAGVMAPE